MRVGEGSVGVRPVCRGCPAGSVACGDGRNLWEVFAVGLFVGEWAGSAELRQVADAGESGVVGVGPWPSGGEAQDQFSSVVDDSSGQTEQAGADCVSVDEPSWFLLGDVVCYPSVEVVSKGGAGKPGGVGEEVPGWAVGQPGVVL